MDLLHEWLALRRVLPDSAEWSTRKQRAHGLYANHFARIHALLRAFGLPDDMRGLEDGSFLYEISDERYGLTVIAIATVILSKPGFRHLATAFEVEPEFNMDNVVELAARLARDDMRSFYRELLEFLLAYEALRGWTSESQERSPLANFAARIEYESTGPLERAETVEYVLGLLLSPEPRAVDLDVLVGEFGYVVEGPQ